MDVRPPLTVRGLANIRDLGGLERENGALTPSGVFIRAEGPDRLDSSGWESLRAYGVRTVIDLRRAEEVAGSVPEDFRRIHVDLDGDERWFWEPLEADGRWGTPLYYLPHVTQLPRRLAAVLEAIADAPDGAVLFHCGAGWDRTGLIATALLKALDVSEDAAVDDYLASFANADAMAALHGRSFDVEERHAVLSRFGHTAESAYRSMYRELDLDEWFHRAGIGDRTRVRITTWRGAVSAA